MFEDIVNFKKGEKKKEKNQTRKYKRGIPGHFFQLHFFIYLLIKINESRYIASFAVSGSIKKLFSPLIMSIFIFSQYFFQQIFPGGKVRGYPTWLIS